MLKFAPEQKTKPGIAIQSKPEPRSPLHNFRLAELARDQDDSCGIWMNELPLLGYIIIRGDVNDHRFNEAIQAVAGVALPVTPHSFVSFHGGILLWQSPDEWLLVCTRSKKETYFSHLKKSLSTLHAQVADNSGGLTMVYVSGAEHITLLRHIGTYDFASIVLGQAIGTVCHRVNMVVFRQDKEGLFILFRRSFADFFWQLLTKSARPYGLGINVVKSHAFHPVVSLVGN